MRIAFLLGDIAMGGGNYVVFQHAQFAQSKGHDVTIISVKPLEPIGQHWHPAMNVLQIVHLAAVQEQSFDIAIATFWKTVFSLDKVNAKCYSYFVQSIESRFFDIADVRMRDLVESTYAMGLPGVTEATWIRDYLKHQYAAEYYLVRNGIRKDIYHAQGSAVAARTPGCLRILVEGPLGVPIKNVARTVHLCNQLAGAEIWLLTSSRVVWYPGVKKLFSNVPVTDVPAIYRSCDVIVKLSFVEGMFGPPLEMFHCGGTAIVYDVSGHDEYIRHGHNALVVKMNDEVAVQQCLEQLRDDTVLLTHLKNGALQTAQQWLDWNKSSADFLTVLLELTAKNNFGLEQFKPRLETLRSEFSDYLQIPAPASGYKSRFKNLIYDNIVFKSIFEKYKFIARNISFWREALH